VMSASLTPLDKALEILLQDVQLNRDSVDVPLDEALGCVLAEGRQAPIDVPGYDNSAMDGYAVNTADLSGPGCSLPVSQSIAAGHVGEPLAAGTAARIFTGACVPKGADAVVIQEDTRAQGETVTILEMPEPGKHIRRRGHDVEKGTEVLLAGHRLRAQDLGLLASLGIPDVSIKAPLTVAIINTGDEVIPPGEPLAPGQIYDSNSFTLEALLSGLGMRTIRLGIVADNAADTKAALADAASLADCIITTGGVSVGEEDHVKQAVEKLGRLALWQLAIKPGKPFSYGRIAGKPFFGLPGNPVAVFITFVTLVKPYLLKTQGAGNLEVTRIRIKAGFTLARAGSRQEYIRVRLGRNGSGEQQLEAFPNQGSSVMTSLSWADGLAEIPMGATVKKGQWVNYIPFNGVL